MSRTTNRLLRCGLLWMLAVSAPALVNAATLLGSLTDPEHPGVNAALDIVAASVTQDGGQLTFEIVTRGDIAPALGSPNDQLVWLWLVDADRDGATGQPHGALGSEFNVRVVAGRDAGGFVDVVGASGGGGYGEVELGDRTVRVTVWLWQVGTPAAFDWRCASFGTLAGEDVPGNDETAIASATPAPYTAPSRVLVTTPIFELCPTGPATGRIEVELRDAGGHLLPPAEHVVTYRSTNPAAAAVDATGTVTALALPEFHWQRPYIEVWADGVMSENAAVVRVTAADLGLRHEVRAREHVRLSLVPLLEGVDLDSLTTHYQVLDVLERAFREQAAAVGGQADPPQTQFLVLDVADDPQTAVCGASGNPICLGWVWGQPQHNSCYIINDPADRVPQWFVMLHEMGHNRTSWCNSFNMFLWQPSGTHNSAWGEGLASLAALWCWQAIAADPSGLGPAAVNDLSRQFSQTATDYRLALAAYQAGGADYDALDPDIVDGILLEMLDRHGDKAWFDLFSTFLPAAEPLPLALDTREKQATWVVAALSASCGRDLRASFRSEYGFPLDDAAWPEILSAVQARVSARTWTPLAVDGGADGAGSRTRIAVVTPNPFRAGVQLSVRAARGGPAALEILDVHGRRVRTILRGWLSAGSHDLRWDGLDAGGRRAAPGVYLARFESPGGVDSRKLTLLE